MMTNSSFKASPRRAKLNVDLGELGTHVGELIYVKDGSREFSQFAYAKTWLENDACFDVSPDLIRHSGFQLRKPNTPLDSCFFGALSDTEPDAWGRRVIARAHAKDREKNASLTALTAIDYLTAVDDSCRIGALRIRTTDQTHAKSDNPPSTLIDLAKILGASRSVELGTETVGDLQYLQGKGTSLGGMRPKCSVQDMDGTLALGKFPSVGDERSVTRGEVLALRLAGLAGIDAADSRIVTVDEQPIAIIRRFDRTGTDKRVPYMSGATMLQARRGDEQAYTEVLDVMRTCCQDFLKDAKQLWRRLLFNHLINNVDDHLQNIGFLYTGKNLWCLSPAFDLNPFPDKNRESKTWLSEDTGPITSVRQLVDFAPHFGLRRPELQAVMGEVVAALTRWREVAISAPVGMTQAELLEFKHAFEGSALNEAKTLIL
jgi:serine/threonine-protein kinase HipA